MKNLKEYLKENQINEFEGKTIKAYKLFNTKGGKLYPLYVNKNIPVEMGVWKTAEEGERAKDNKSGGRMVKSKLGDLAYRPGWHAGDYPMATHIGGKSKGKGQAEPDYRPDNQVWAEVLMSDEVDWQARADAKGTVLKSGPFKGQISAKSKAITDQIPLDGHYRFKTNNNMTGNWIISGNMMINRVLSDDEVKKINAKGGYADLPRLSELKAAEAEKAKSEPTDKFPANTSATQGKRMGPDDSSIDDLKTLSGIKPS